MAPSEVVPDPITSARKAGLRYVNDEQPGLTRHRAGRGFTYRDAQGKTVRDRATRERIARLVIPPAWKDVWICPLENGHLQATGRDARGRKQYRYHADWSAFRDSTKYDKMIAFGRALPAIRRRVKRDMKGPGLSRTKVLAAVVRLLETTLIRVGNDEYARENSSYGLTTIRHRHVKTKGRAVTFEFRGKSGKDHAIDVRDPALRKIVKKCLDLPGYELFQYLEADGTRHDVTSTDVNDYLHEIVGDAFTAKDFRTWAGTVLAARALREFEKFETGTEAKRNLVAAVEAVAKMLGNTPAVCRKCYVHPVIFDTYLAGTLIERLEAIASAKIARDLHSLRPEEAAVLMLLQQKLKNGTGKG